MKTERVSIGVQGDIELLVDAIGDRVYNTIIRNNKHGVQVEFVSNSTLTGMRTALDAARESSSDREAFEDAAFFRDAVKQLEKVIEP